MPYDRDVIIDDNNTILPDLIYFMILEYFQVNARLQNTDTLSILAVKEGRRRRGGRPGEGNPSYVLPSKSQLLPYIEVLQSWCEYRLLKLRLVFLFGCFLFVYVCVVSLCVCLWVLW